MKLKVMKMICNFCKQEFERKKIDSSENHYCSRACLGKANKERYRKESLMNCDFCGKEFEYRGRHKKRNKHFYCSRDCSYKAKSKKLLVKCDWCNKQFLKKRNDIERTETNFCSTECTHNFHRWSGISGSSPKVEGVPIHRKIMSEYLNRPLNSYEEVHHIDGNHSNNKIENLELLNKTEHSKVHASIKKRDNYGKFIKTE